MKAVLVGATGLTGSYLLQHLLDDNYFEQIVTLTRKPLQVHDNRYLNIVVNFDDYKSLQNAVDDNSVIFVAIGTTQKDVNGDKTAYRKIDFDIPVNMAKIAKEKNVQTFVMVSSVGARVDGANFYIRLKGEIENAVADMGIKSVNFLRPSLIVGERKKLRKFEGFFRVIMIPLSAMFFGSMRKFKSIHVKDLSMAMLKAAKANKPGKHILHYDEIMKIIH